MRSRAGIQTIHLTQAHYAAQPWKNGGGVTNEIAKGTGDPFPWRLSFAALTASGPFSDFPGYYRVLLLLNGPGIELQHDDKKPRILSPLTACKFKGEWRTVATLREPCTDFNLFTLREKAKGAVYPTWLTQDETQFPLMGNEHFVFCVDGEIEIHEPNEKRDYRLFPQETLRVSRDTTKEFLNLRARGAKKSVALWVVIHTL